MVVGGGPLLPILERGRVEVKPVVDVHFCSFRDESDHPDHLMVLVAQPDRIGVTTVVEKGHCREDCSAYWNDVEFRNVIILQNTLGHLQAIGSGHLQMAEKEA